MHDTAYLSVDQIAKLLEPINPERVDTDGKGFRHVEAWEIRAQLNRVFGFARWSEDLISQQLIFEEPGKKQKFENNRPVGDPYDVWSVAYRSVIRLTVCAPDGTELAFYTEGAVGESLNQPHRHEAHDGALKTSESQALKRCAVNLGDQFGLSLYSKKRPFKAIVSRLWAGPVIAIDDARKAVLRIAVAPVRNLDQTPAPNPPATRPPERRR